MSTSPQKVQGPWNQGIYEISATAKEIVGTKREDQFGNVYRYAKAGGTALDPGKNTTLAATSTDWQNKEVDGDYAVGATVITFDVGDVGSDELDEDFFRGGQLQINDEAGEGTWYRILHSTAVEDGDTSCTVTLQEGIKVALTDDTSKVTPVPSPWMETVISATETLFPTGVPLVTVTADYYYWSQTKGLGVYWADDDVAALGSALVLAADDGKLVPLVLDFDTTSAADLTQKIVAHAVGRDTAVDTEYCPCVYCID
jgi:hypothetical protein